MRPVLLAALLAVPYRHARCFGSTFWVNIVAEILIWSLLAASVNLLFGYVGLLSFGQALYFGFGMYGVALSVIHWGVGFWPALALGDRRGQLHGGRRRQLRGAPDLALLRDHHGRVLADLLLRRA